jgi:hypothetical protein
MLGKHTEFMERKLSRFWTMTLRTAFFLVLAIVLFLLFMGIARGKDMYTHGSIGVDIEANGAGEIVLDPWPGYDAEAAGIKSGDVLLSVDGQDIASDVNKIAESLRGEVGSPVTITLRSTDGSQKTLTIIRSAAYQARIKKAGLTVDKYATFFVVLPVLIGLLFAALGVYVILRRGNDWLFPMAAFALLLFPFSLNAAGIAYNGALASGMNWLYQCLRAVGLFLTCWLLFVYPNGKFFPKWTRWFLAVIAVWIIPYLIDLLVYQFLPGQFLDIAWMLLLALGIFCQVVRLRTTGNENERIQTRPLVIGAVVAFSVYLVIWLGRMFGLANLFTGGAVPWYYIVAELILDAALLIFGFGLTLGYKVLAE